MYSLYDFLLSEVEFHIGFWHLSLQGGPIMIWTSILSSPGSWPTMIQRSLISLCPATSETFPRSGSCVSTVFRKNLNKWSKVYLKNTFQQLRVLYIMKTSKGLFILAMLPCMLLRGFQQQYVFSSQSVPWIPSERRFMQSAMRHGMMTAHPLTTTQPYTPQLTPHWCGWSE